MLIAVCDNEPEMTLLIKNKIAEELRKMNTDDFEIDVFNDGQSLLSKNAVKHYDAVFLDIEMPDKNGIEIATYLNDMCPDVIKIFVSAYDRYVYDTIKTSPTAFVRKQRMEEDFPDAVREMCRKYESMNCVITIETSKGRVEFKPEKLMYVESSFHKIILHYEQNKIVELTYAIKDLEGILESKGFIRIHKSFLVNYRYIYQMIRYKAFLTDMVTELDISRNRYEIINNTFMDWIGGLR